MDSITVETHIPVVVGTNPLIYTWLPVCTCYIESQDTSGRRYCPVHSNIQVEYNKQSP